MGIKDLFGKRSNKVVTKAQVDKLLDEVESSDLVLENKGKNNKLIPRIDYSQPENFARYGSAEKYYEDTFNHIHRTYPYDGSAAEKMAWRNEASGLDEYLLDTSYPSAVGHVHLNSGASVDTSYVESDAGHWQRYDSPQYIKVKGGPNKDPSVKDGDPYELSKQFPPKGGRANIWDEGLFQESNLGINPSYGNTIEFWGKFENDEWMASRAACLFDLWNGEDIGATNYVRFMVEVLPLSGNDFSITYKYGNGAEGTVRCGVNLTASTKTSLGANWRKNWHHYAFAVSSTAAGIKIELYIDGVHETTVVSGGEITSTLPQENYIANINALRARPSTLVSGIKDGDGGAPGFYLDEFRFWKSTRNGKQIGRNWFTSVNGGTNTDTSKYHKETGDMVDLGVYYKFNEGIFNPTSVGTYEADARCLDYSGRISNGEIVNYTLGTRIATSAMDASAKVATLGATEAPDPIMYASHPDVSALKTKLMFSGSVWDMQNNSSFYHTMPQWILEEDEQNLMIRELSQTLSSYFDSVHHQIDTLAEIRDNKYLDLSDTQSKPFFFAKQLLRSVGFDVTDIFTEATALEEVVSRGEQELFDARIQEIKNVIYQNIYNNISYIYKSKGTEKSFRNLVRCFGVDDELIKLNLYADGVDYTLDGRYSYTALKKNYIDFNSVDREEAVVYSRDVSPSSSDERGFIAGMTSAQAAHLSTTLTAEVIFPKQLTREHPKYVGKSFNAVSLFGTKEANSVAPYYDEDPIVALPRTPVRFKVEAIRPENNSDKAKFRLSYTYDGGSGTLETDEYKEIYDNTKWNFAVRLTPTGAPLADYVSGSTVTNYKLEFYGVQMTLDVVEREFTKTATIATADAINMIKAPKIVYVGHYRADFSDKNSGGYKTDVKVTDVMYWFDYLADEEIKSHASDASNSGRLYPNDDAYAFFSQLSSGASSDIRVPRKDTLALHWDFSNITTSDSLSEATVNDISQGGADYIAENRYGWFTDLVGYRHQALFKGDTAAPNDNQIVNREYQYTAKHRQPEILAGDDMVEIRTQDDNVFTKDSRPINHFWAIEKSMYQVISDEMLNMFASIIEFNDLIGQPVHRYRLEYKSLQKFRSLFYEKVENTPSFEKFVGFYKWLDSSLGMMMQQLIPASGNFSDSMRNMVESHILERNKYWTKFPTLEMKQDPPEGTIRGIRELTYDWEHGHAPVDRYNKKVVLFDGTDDHIEVNNDAAFSFTDGGGNDEPFSISAWVYVEDASVDNGPFVTKALVSGGAAGLEYIFKHFEGQLRVFIYTSPGTGNRITLQTDAAVLTDKTWHHVVCTYDGSKASGGIALYLDGAQITSTNTTLNLGTYTGMAVQTTPLIIGKTHNDPPAAGQVFEHKMADVCMFNKSLSSAEVSELYNQGEVYNLLLHSASSNIIAWWKMGDGDTAPTIQDSVGGHHGTLGGGAVIVDEFELPSVLDYDESEHCLWRAERAERNVVDATEIYDVDKDRESIRKAKVRDILGQNKMVPVGTDGFVEQGEPTLYDIKTSTQYEGSTYATRRLSRPYKLNLEKALSIKGGPNFADATLASPNDMLRAATQRSHKITMQRLADDAETCRDDYTILDGSSSEKRRAHVVRLTDVATVTTEMKGSLFAPPFYGEYPNDANATQRNITHDSYGQDHEIPMQGVFAAEWVGGNQHRHIDLNMERTHIVSGVSTVKLDDKHVRPELYVDNGGNLVHPFDGGASTNPATVLMAARYTRDGLAKRPFNISNINTAVNKDNYTSYTGTPKLGNYTRDYEIIQTSGRTQNNRWLVKNPTATPDSIHAASWVTGLYDYTLPVRTKDSANNEFGRTEHIFVERFSAPGSPATLSRGALDYQAEEFSPYNSLNYRNIRVRNHLNFWHKEHTAQFGYREDYIHGTPDDALGGVSNDFGGNTANVGAWHKNNRNPLTRMHLQQPNVESRRRYDNFYVSHQIPQSDWQYHWITSSAVHFNMPGQPILQEYDDEERGAYNITQFPWNNDGDGDATDNIITHPRISGFVSGYPNLTIGVSGSMDYLLTGAGAGAEVSAPGLLLSGSIGIDHNPTIDATTQTEVIDVDFVYGNYVIVDPVDWRTNTLGTYCPDCPTHRKINEFGFNQRINNTHGSELNAMLLNRNGPYQGAGWKMLKGVENPIVRQQRRRNIISVQNVPDGLREFKIYSEARPGKIRVVLNGVPANNFDILFHSQLGISTTSTVTVASLAANDAPTLASMIATAINSADEQANGDDASKIEAVSTPGSSIVDIVTKATGSNINNNLFITFKIQATDLTFSGDNLASNSKFIFTNPAASLDEHTPLPTESNSLSIGDDGARKVIKIFFRGASDASQRMEPYIDRRSDKHEKFIEPPATWNRPMVHITSEKGDFVGTKSIHSYSNNLETFANPKLTYRTGFVKDNKQVYDSLLQKYSKAQSEYPSHDFVGMYYKEYIFPKHRNVGLLKIRGRVKWDDISNTEYHKLPTGDIRVFWKDNPFDRIKGSRGAVNAIGYSPIVTSNFSDYLLEDIGESHRMMKSIFSMDNFPYKEVGSSSAWTVLGDLQYVGVATYLSWIVNRNCTVADGATMSMQELILTPINPGGHIHDGNFNLATNQAVTRNASQLGGSSDDGNQGAATGGNLRVGAAARSFIDGGSQGVPPAMSRAQQRATDEAVAAAVGAVRSEQISGQSVVFGARELQMIAAMRPADASIDTSAGVRGVLKDLDNSGLAQTMKRHKQQSPRCQAPEPVVQLYYNPWSESSYREVAWQYMTNQISGKNPWYDKYVDFNLETRAMAQNYGLVAEFNVSEHMNKYILEDSGDFRNRNYNFLSLKGASYMTESPHAAIVPTEYSGKITYPTQMLYSLDGTTNKTVSTLIHSDDRFSRWIGLGSSPSAIRHIREGMMVTNNAVSHRQGIGTFNNPPPYRDYLYKNDLYTGGNMSISNSTPTSLGPDIDGSSVWQGIPSWGDDKNDGSGYGRHRFFAQGLPLDESETSDYENVVYREAESYSNWRRVAPLSRGKISALKFNMDGNTDEFLHGVINRWDNATNSSPMDTEINLFRPFYPLGIKTVTDTWRVPNKQTSEEQDPPAVARKEIYAPDGNQSSGTPVTISVWAKPEDTSPCGDDIRYDGNPVGLYVFGAYSLDKVNQFNTHLSGAWRKSTKGTFTAFGLFSNYPAPNQVRDGYPSGMGLTFFLGGGHPDFHHKFAGESETGVADEGIYHFFRKNDDSTYEPAVLPEGEWSHVILQILPATGSGTSATTPAKIKLILRSPGKDKATDTLYGIHRAALINGTVYEKAALRVVPVGKSDMGHNFWTQNENYGVSNTSFWRIPAQEYKLGKATFKDVADYNRRRASFRGQLKARQHYFKGELTEFSMWAGILNEGDVAWMKSQPMNILEGLLNGEVTGGYTSDTRANAEWGSSTPTLALSPPYVINTTANPLNSNRITSFGIDLGASRFTCKLPVWHRIGVQPIVNVLEKCEDWDDEFFNSYVHSDTVQFFDAVVEDHDVVSDTIRKRLRLKVNALKKLVPYRGFYPQDRTLQLAKLFKEKMVDSITGADGSVLHEEQAMQAALQPFFAPGILYNSIKAGIAVDWPAFTNETGLEPTYPNSEVELPYYNEDIHGIDEATMHENGPTVPTSSIVPNWYRPRENPTSALEGLLLDGELQASPPDASYWTNLRESQMASLREVQPKFFPQEPIVEAAMGVKITDQARKNGYIILDEPNTRIPFEGLVALDSVLPSAADSSSEEETAVSESSFRHIDLEISGWDCEGVEITIIQPEPLTGYGNPDNYPVGGDIKNNWTATSKSITIGDPDREIASDDWDVEVNFRRPPKGWKMPSFDQNGEYDDEEAQWAMGEESVTIDELNEEIAMKLCREINNRQDIHYVAIPGRPIGWDWSRDTFSTPDKLTDDHVARLFPVAYPEVFGIKKEDFTPELLSEIGEDSVITSPKLNVAKYENEFWNNETTNFGSPWSKIPPSVGKQHNGTWRIRLVYVGPPKLEFDMNLVELHEGINWRAEHNAEPDFDLEKITRRPFNGMYPDDSLNPTPYDENNSYHTWEWGTHSHGFLNGLCRHVSSLFGQPWPLVDLEPVIPMPNDFIKFFVPQENYKSDGGLGWKAMHIVCPFQAMEYNNDGIATGNVELPTGWVRRSSTEPYGFFDGGGWVAMDDEELTMGELCNVSVTRHLGTLQLCKWIDGWGWKGSAKYSIDTELGVRCVNSAGKTVKGNGNDKARMDYVTGKIYGKKSILGIGTGKNNAYFLYGLHAAVKDASLGIDAVISQNSDNEGGVVLMEESAKSQQGPFFLYGGVDSTEIEAIRITPKPYQMYLMVPEYYMGHADGAGGDPLTGRNWAAKWQNYCYPYFEYLGSNGDPRFEMAMHNFLAEVPNFFLQDQTLVSFSSKPESQFKTMNAGTTYYMDVTMYQSDKFCTVASPHSDISALGSPRHIAFNSSMGERLTMEGRYFGPSFKWKATEDYANAGAHTSMDKQLIRDPAQAPYVPPYLYGKAVARISFTAPETRKYSLEEIFAGASVDNDSKEQFRRFARCAAEDNGSSESVNTVGIISSPAYKARTTISASMNLFGKATIKKVEYSAQLARLRDAVDESLQKFVPITATDPEGNDNDVWVIGTKFECPILNFYNGESVAALATPPRQLFDGTFIPGRLQSNAQMALAASNPRFEADFEGRANSASSSVSVASGTGIWAGYGKVPNSNEGVFVTVEESNKSRKDFSTPKGTNVGSLIDVCGFKPEKQKVGEIAEAKEISEAVVMIPFVDAPSEATAETVVVDGRNFFKINKDLFNIQKSNIEAGEPAIKPMQWFGVSSNEEIQETSISRMIKLMKKYNLPPKFDFVRYPMKSSEDPFVMYIFEFNHNLSRQDLSDIWQGLPPQIALQSEHDSATILHDLSPVDFFEENTLPKNVRWMTFKVKKRAKTDYFSSTAATSDDTRFEFNFELGKKAPKYSYNWPYDFFTMLELIQVEAGLDLIENTRVGTVMNVVRSEQGELSASSMQEEIASVKTQSTQDTNIASVVSSHVFGSDKDR